jgi:hypothetical protein
MCDGMHMLFYCPWQDYSRVILTIHVNLVVKLQVVLSPIRSGRVENNIYAFKG